jgi:uncharacterized protein
MLKSIVAMLGVLAIFSTNPVFAEDVRTMRTIVITGHGEVSAVPDLAVVSLGVSTQGNSAREALDGNSKSMKALLDTLTKAGIEARDMATSNFSIGPRLDYGNNNNKPPKVVGYDVNNMVTITIRKIDDVGDILDVAVSTGSNTINGITFSVSKPDALLTDARKAAVVDARSKAELYATAGGFKLGDIISLSETSLSQAPVANYARSAAADTVPIAQGEQALTVDVNITYEIK